eukprot:gene13330-17867_t
MIEDSCCVEGDNLSLAYRTRFNIIRENHDESNSLTDERTSKLPSSIIQNHILLKNIRKLDLTETFIRDFSDLKLFDRLESLIVDNNKLTTSDIATCPMKSLIMLDSLNVDELERAEADRRGMFAIKASSQNKLKDERSSSRFSSSINGNISSLFASLYYYGLSQPQVVLSVDNNDVPDRVSHQDMPKAEYRGKAEHQKAIDSYPTHNYDMRMRQDPPRTDESSPHFLCLMAVYTVGVVHEQLQIISSLFVWSCNAETNLLRAT